MVRFTTGARNSLSDAVIGLKRISVFGGAGHSLFLKIIGFGTFRLGSLNFWREVQMVVCHVFFSPFEASAMCFLVGEMALILFVYSTL